MTNCKSLSSLKSLGDAIKKWIFFKTICFCNFFLNKDVWISAWWICYGMFCTKVTVYSCMELINTELYWTGFISCTWFITWTLILAVNDENWARLYCMAVASRIGRSKTNLHSFGQKDKAMQQCLVRKAFCKLELHSQTSNPVGKHSIE